MTSALPHPVAPLPSLLWPKTVDSTAKLLSHPGLELTFNGRGALLSAFRELRAAGRSRVLLPAYHCPSVVTPALMAGLEPVFYRIDRDLRVDAEDVLRKSDDNVAAIVVIRFFGLPVDLEVLAPVRHRGVQVVEDCSHSFISDQPLRLAGDESSEYRIYSFWKIVPSGIGGALLRRDSTAAPRRPASVSHRLRAYKCLAEEALVHSPNRLMSRGAQAAEQFRLSLRQKSAPKEPTAPPPTLEQGEQYYPVDAVLAEAAMPGFAKRALKAADLREIARRRRANFHRFSLAATRLRPMQPLGGDLADGSCPWVFPVLLEGRDGLDHRLRDSGVPLHTFGLYLHSALFNSGTDKRTLNDARFLAQRLLCLSVHQDLGPDNIDDIIDIASEQLRRAGAT
jgi:perosamine synthetase